MEVSHRGSHGPSLILRSAGGEQVDMQDSYGQLCPSRRILLLSWLQQHQVPNSPGCSDHVVVGGMLPSTHCFWGFPLPKSLRGALCLSRLHLLYTLSFLGFCDLGFLKPKTRHSHLMRQLLSRNRRGSQQSSNLGLIMSSWGRIGSQTQYHFLSAIPNCVWRVTLPPRSNVVLTEQAAPSSIFLGNRYYFFNAFHACVKDYTHSLAIVTSFILHDHPER